MMRFATLCATATVVAGQAAQEACASDVDGDGLVNVNDLLSMLSQFGAEGARPEDVNDDNVVNVNDLLQLLSNFGGNLEGCGRDGMAGGSDGTEAVNCCGGGAACGFLHCPALGAGQDGCVQPWAMPNGMNFETDCAAIAEPAVEAPLWCPESPPQMCRMMCPEAEACPAGQCNMREGNCCSASCQAFEPAECTGCCPAGAACFAPDPPCCAQQAASCGQGEDCGGQVWNDCGTSCPAICGQPAAMICNMMCNAEYQCPASQCFNEQTGQCERAGGDAIGGGGGLPVLAPGRPFLATAKYDPTPHKIAPVALTSSAVGGASDWMVAL